MITTYCLMRDDTKLTQITEVLSTTFELEVTPPYFSTSEPSSVLEYLPSHRMFSRPLLIQSGKNGKKKDDVLLYYTGKTV